MRWTFSDVVVWVVAVAVGWWVLPSDSSPVVLIVGLAVGGMIAAGVIILLKSDETRKPKMPIGVLAGCASAMWLAWKGFSSEGQEQVIWAVVAVLAVVLAALHWWRVATGHEEEKHPDEAH